MASSSTKEVGKLDIHTEPANVLQTAEQLATDVSVSEYYSPEKKTEILRTLSELVIINEARLAEH